MTVVAAVAAGLSVGFGGCGILGYRVKYDGGGYGLRC